MRNVRIEGWLPVSVTGGNSVVFVPRALAAPSTQTLKGKNPASYLEGIGIHA